MCTPESTPVRVQLAELPELNLPPSSQLAACSEGSILHWESPDSEPDTSGISWRVCFLPGVLVSMTPRDASVLVHGGSSFTFAVVGVLRAHSAYLSPREHLDGPQCAPFRPGYRALSRACLSSTCPVISRVCAGSGVARPWSWLTFDLRDTAWASFYR